MKTILHELSATGDSVTYKALLAQDYTRTPVSIEQFLDDEHYLGEFTSSLFPEWREELVHIFDPRSNIYEFLATGAIGIGKNTVASIMLAYLLYKLSCLKNPAEYYDLMKGSNIVFGIYGITREKADSVGYGHLRRFVERSEYFNTTFVRDKRYKEYLIFPNRVSVISGSSNLHAIGENIFAFLLDEANFMKGEGDEGKAYDLYTSCRRRIVSRFMHLGRIPGMMILISSRRTHTDFLETHIAKHRNDPGVYVSEFALWQVKKKSYSGDTFKVFKGDQFKSPRIFTVGEIPTEDEAVNMIDVPVEHRNDFESDLENSLRDIAGVPISANMPLLRSRETLYSCIVKERRHPFTKESLTLSHLDKDEIGNYLIQDELLTVRGGRLCPKVDRVAPRIISIDLSRKNDSASITMSHVTRLSKVRGVVDGKEGRMVSGVLFPVLLPHVYVDFSIRIVPPKVGEIDFAAIRRFILFLREMGFNIYKVFYDSYQSADSIQILQANGIDAGVYSVDRDDVAYVHLRQAIREHRLNMYWYPPFLSEVINLNHDQVNRKVDHPKEMVDIEGNRVVGSKDVADTIASSTKNCVEIPKEILLTYITEDMIVEEDTSIVEMATKPVETAAEDVKSRARNMAKGMFRDHRQVADVVSGVR